MNLVFLTSVAVTVWETVSAFVPQLLPIQEAVAELVSVLTGERLPFAVSIALKMHTEKQCSMCSGMWEIKKSRILTSLCMRDLASSCLQDLEDNPCPVSETWRFFYSSVPAVFCDYYNPPDKHEWFYKPCGAPCLKTCRNPQGKCGNLLYSLEGNSCLSLMQFMGVEGISLVLNVLSIKVAERLPHLPQKLIDHASPGLIPCVMVPFIAKFACCL